jgi:hypothetical protein
LREKELFISWCRHTDMYVADIICLHRRYECRTRILLLLLLLLLQLEEAPKDSHREGQGQSYENPPMCTTTPSSTILSLVDLYRDRKFGKMAMVRLHWQQQHQQRQLQEWNGMRVDMRSIATNLNVSQCSFIHETKLAR